MFSRFLRQNSFKPKTTLIILLAWPNIVPGISCIFIKLKGDKDRVRHTFSRVTNPFKTVTQIGAVCQHWIRTAPGVCSDSWHPQTRNSRNISSQRVLGEDIWEKLGFPGMITSVSCLIDKMSLKLPRKSSIIIRRACRLHSPNSILYCPQSPLVLAKWVCPCGLLPHLETPWKRTHIVVCN